LIALKKNHKPVEEAMVEEPTHNSDVPPKTNMEEQKDYEKQEDHDDHESKEGQHSIVFFKPKQLEII
jgi:hypothetical protein